MVEMEIKIQYQCFFCDSYSVMLNSTLQPSSDNIYTANDED